MERIIYESLCLQIFYSLLGNIFKLNDFTEIVCFSLFIYTKLWQFYHLDQFSVLPTDLKC